MRHQMNLAWLALAILLPAIASLLVAWPLWARQVRDEIGSITGAAVVLLFTLVHIAREFATALAFQNQCFAAGRACHFEPEPFTRYAIYAGVGMLQVFLVFVVGLRVQERGRRRPTPPGARSPDRSTRHVEPGDSTR
jgi:4-amino-4-deoxy-L-arabinose transferase-like glycosyltransferase